MWVRVCALVLRWLLFLGVDIINAVRAGSVCWCVFVFVSHSFLFSHILSDAVSNHSTTCCIWLKLHVSVYLLWLLIRKSRRLCHRLCHHCSHRKFLLSSKVVELSLSMIFSYIKKVFSRFRYSFRFRSLAPIPSKVIVRQWYVYYLFYCLLGIIPLFYPFVFVSLSFVLPQTCVFRSFYACTVCNCAIFVHIYAPCHRHPSNK